MTIKRCSKGRIPIVKRYLGENFLSPVKNGPRNGTNSGKLESRYEILCSKPRKVTSLRGTACFGIFCVKIRPGPLAVASCKNPKKPKNQHVLVRKVTHARRRNAWMDRWIVTNLYTGVGVHDVITCADLYYDCLRGLGVAGGQILAFSIDLLRRPYNTRALPCECSHYVRVCDLSQEGHTECMCTLSEFTY